MEIAITILVASIIIILAKVGSHNKTRGQLKDISKSKKDADIDELITVVLPVINNDK